MYDGENTKDFLKKINKDYRKMPKKLLVNFKYIVLLIKRFTYNLSRAAYCVTYFLTMKYRFIKKIRFL